MAKYELIAYSYTGHKPLKEMRDEDIKMLTGINLAFGQLTPEGSLSTRILGDDVACTVKHFKEINPELKVIISIGGYRAGYFSDTCLTKAGRKRFIGETVAYVRANGLDGVDLDWEFPTRKWDVPDARPEDKYTFTMVCREFREALNSYEQEDGKHYVLSMAAGSEIFVNETLEVRKLAEILDYIQIMTYDLRTYPKINNIGAPIEILSGHHTNLYPSKGDPMGISIERCVELYRTWGVPSEKLVIGSAFYTKIWRGVGAENNGLLQKNETGEEYGPAYADVIENRIDKNGWTYHWDEDAKASYITNGEDLISYDDARSVAEKIKYLKAENLKGIMFWQYFDDATCTLLKAHYDAFQE